MWPGGPRARFLARRGRHRRAAASLGAGLALTPASAAPALPFAVAAPDATVAVQLSPRERRMVRRDRMDRRMMRHERRAMHRRMMHRRMMRGM